MGTGIRLLAATLAQLPKDDWPKKCEEICEPSPADKAVEPSARLPPKSCAKRFSQ